VYSPEGFALSIFQSRHAAHVNETWHEACDRVAQHVANAELGEERNSWRDKFADVLKWNHFMPGGRIWYGSGRARGQLLNCFSVPSGDSREEWGQTVSDSIIISGTGGGVGINCSHVRPRGQPIRGTGGTATGAVSLMEIINAAGEAIKAGGGRRTALMLALDITHGDIVEFLDKKLDLNQLNNANVSVWFDGDPEDFFAAVKADTEWTLLHQGREVGKVSAKSLWERIVKNALKGGEPGLLNGYLANQMSNIWYLEKLVITNPCGEIHLSPYDCCCLGALVLPRFIVDGEVDWGQLEYVTKLGIRFLDDVLTVNQYPLTAIQAKCSQLRRIGLGIMGLHHMLLELGLKYNAPSGLEFVDMLMKKIKNWSYEASSDIAAEKGSFPAFEAEKFLRSGFCKTLKPSLREKIRKDGMRNCAVNTIAPTGTISIVCDVSSGIEPIFAAAHERRFRKGEEIAMEVVVDPIFQRFVNEGRGIKHFVGAHDLSIRDHMEMQRVCQKHIDNAVSKTIQVSADTPWQELSELYMEYFPELKGVTIYPDGSRENQPLTPIPLDRAKELAEASKTTTLATSADACKSGVCDI
jgi:ribonucleoside-diphosphate reductase alpha chain